MKFNPPEGSNLRNHPRRQQLTQPPPKAATYATTPEGSMVIMDKQRPVSRQHGNVARWARRQRRLLGAVFGIVVVLALVTAGCSPAGPPAGTPGKAAGPLWLCRPGQGGDPCSSSVSATAVTAAGALEPATWPSSAAASRFACFYLNPTSSLTQTRSGNTGLAVTQLEKYIATEEAAPFSQVCDVWSPLYRSQTFPTVLKGLSGDENLMRSTATVAYDSVLPAWQWFLAHTGGKPIILIGDSQGATILIHLISAQLDHQPPVLRRLLVAILVGGNLQVPSGKVIGSTFTNVALCTSATQTGCAIAFSSFSSQPPANSVFGRPGQGTSLQVACVNPAALGGGTGDLLPYLLTAAQIQAGLKEPVHTPWVTYPGLYSATCEHGGGATWLQVASLAGTSHTRPVVTEAILPGIVDTGPAWGYHGYEYNLTLGSLLHDVAGQEAAWQSSH
jgi:hypothetical protein